MNDSVLVIERHHDVGDTIRLMVEAAGYRAMHVCTIDAALTELSRKHFDIVMTSSLFISSLKMVSFAWLAKQLQPNLNVVLTAAGEGINSKAHFALDAYLIKPFSIGDICNTLIHLPHLPLQNFASSSIRIQELV